MTFKQKTKTIIPPNTEPTEDTRPSLFGGFNCTLSYNEQAKAAKEFEQFYLEQADKLIWSSEKSLCGKEKFVDAYATNNEQVTMNNYC